MNKLSMRIITIFMAILLSFSTIFAPAIYANTAHDVQVAVSEDGKTTNGAVDKVKIEIAGITDRDGGQQNFWSVVLSKYRGIIVMISGVAALTFVLFFIINFIKLGKASSNPQERSNCITAIVMTGIAAAGCGGVALFVGVFYNMLL